MKKNSDDHLLVSWFLSSKNVYNKLKSVFVPWMTFIVIRRTLLFIKTFFFLNVWFFPFLCLMESSFSDNCSLLLLWMHCCAIQFRCTHLKQVMFRTKGKRRLENLMCIALEEGCINNTTNLYTSTNVMQFTWFPSSALVSLSSFLMHSEVFIIQFLFFFLFCMFFFVHPRVTL